MSRQLNHENYFSHFENIDSFMSFAQKA